MNAPITRTEKYLNSERTMHIENIAVTRQDASMYEGVDGAIEIDDEHYIISYHEWLGMPSWKSERYATLQEVTNAMRGIADLRKWNVVSEEE